MCNITLEQAFEFHDRNLQIHFPCHSSWKELMNYLWWETNNNSDLTLETWGWDKVPFDFPMILHLLHYISSLSCIMYSRVNYINHILDYIPSIYLITGSLYFLTIFIQLPHPSDSPPLATPNLISFSMSLLFKYNWTFNSMLVCGVQHSDSVFLCISKWSPW